MVISDASLLEIEARIVGIVGDDSLVDNLIAVLGGEVDLHCPAYATFFALNIIFSTS
jgi:hypothetical protein